jgi:hypothetical protein
MKAPAARRPWACAHGATLCRERGFAAWAGEGQGRAGRLRTVLPVNAHYSVIEPGPAIRHPSAMRMICATTSAAAATSHTQPMSARMVDTSPAAPTTAIAAAVRAGAPPVARHNDGRRRAMGSQHPRSMATPSRSSGEGPCVLLKAKTRSPESGSATTAAPTTEPAIHRSDRHDKDFLVTPTLSDALSEQRVPRVPSLVAAHRHITTAWCEPRASGDLAERSHSCRSISGGGMRRPRVRTRRYTTPMVSQLAPSTRAVLSSFVRR